MAEKENALKECRDLMDKAPPERRTPDGTDWMDELLDRRLKDMAGRSPLIVWHRMHPENGRAERPPAPPEGGAAFREGGRNDHWRPMPDGPVRMGIFDNALAERGAARPGAGPDQAETAGVPGAEGDGAGPGPADGRPPAEGHDEEGRGGGQGAAEREAEHGKGDRGDP